MQQFWFVVSRLYGLPFFLLGYLAGFTTCALIQGFVDGKEYAAKP